MANNRMFLVHVPSRTAVNLGKNMLSGWYLGPGNDVTQSLQVFYEYLENEHGVFDNPDQFAIWTEYSEEWNTYEKGPVDGLLTLAFDEEFAEKDKAIEPGNIVLNAESTRH